MRRHGFYSTIGAVALFMIASLAWAEPSKDPQPLDVPTPAEGEPADPGAHDALRSLEITSPKVTGVSTDPVDIDYFFPHTRSLNLYFSPYYRLLAGDVVAFTLIGVSYLWESDNSFHYESGFDTTSAGDGRMWVTGRWITNASKRLRPYLAAGPGIKLVASNGLATIFNSDNFFGRFAAGAERSFIDELSWRAELLAMMSLRAELLLGVSVGISYGF